MAIHDWSIGGSPADAHALREALALERQSRKKASALEYERLQAERNARAVGAALRRQMRERGMTRVWLRVRPKATSGRRDGVRRCRRIETMAGLVVAKRSHRGADGLSSFHFKWTGRGFGERRKHASRRYRVGEAVRHLRYILRDGACEISGGGVVSNVSLDPGILAGVFSALEELESHGRDNANVYVSVVVSLPSELTAEQRESLLARICMIVGREGLPHVGVLHAPDPKGDQRNNHAHIMMSLRPCRVEPDGSFAFAAGTAADLNDASFIKMMRSEIADLMNEAMMAAGHERRFTALSNQERGLPARSKRKGKSTPGRKHHERRRERTDLMAGERGYRHERIEAINDFQQELIAELVTPHIDRTAAIEATKAHRAKAIPIIPPAAEPAPSPPPSPVARTQPVAAPETRSRIGKLVRRIEEDDDAPRALVQRLKDLEAAETRLAADLADTPEQTVVRLPTNYEAVYARAIAELEMHLGGGDASAAREAIRALVEKVVVQPGDGRGGKRRPIQLHGDLFEMLAFASAAGSGVDKRKLPRTVGSGGVVLPLVAGTGSIQQATPAYRFDRQVLFYQSFRTIPLQIPHGS